MIRKILSLTLGLILCLSVLAGCAADEPEAVDERDELEILFGSLDLDEPTPTPTPLEALYYDYSDYRGILQDMEYRYEETMGGDYLLYALCDLDGDGVLELLVQDGTSEADMIWQVYTVGEMGAQSVGSFSGGHSLLYTDAEPGILCLYGQMGHERIDRITYDGQYLSVQTLTEQDLPEGGPYSTPGASVATALISDPGMVP